MLQGSGDAVVLMLADLQDPPSLIPEFIKYWEAGYEVIFGTRSASKEPFLLFRMKKLYYWLANSLAADVHLTRDTTGFGLYDQRVIQQIRNIQDPYPYFKGLISELGFRVKTIPYISNIRKHGVSSANLYVLYDYAILGITSHSRIPLQVATVSGFLLSLLSILVALGYLVAKLIFWDFLPTGIASLIVGLFFISSVQLFFIGIIGEYLGLLHQRSLRRPVVLERERINFSQPNSQTESD